MRNALSSSLPSVALAVASIAFSATMAANPAQAFTVSIDPKFGSVGNTGSTANLDFNFVQSGVDVLLKLGIKNTTNGSAGLGATQSTLVGLAFDLLGGGVTSYSYNPMNSAFTKTYTNVATPGPYGDVVVDYGIRSEGSGSFFDGNAQGGLTAGQSTLVSFLLKGTSSLTATDVENSFLSRYSSGAMNVAARFQQVNVGSGNDKVLGEVVETPPVSQAPAEAVPEPTTMLGLATAGALLFGKKRLQRKAC